MWIVTIFGETINQKKKENNGKNVENTASELVKKWQNYQSFNEEKNKRKCIGKEIDQNLWLYYVLLKYIKIIYLKLYLQVQ